MTTNPATNPYGWPTPVTDEMLSDALLAPLPTPAESIAERLVMLAHLSFDSSVWGISTGRLGGYWLAFGNRIEVATSEITVATWWETLMRELPGVAIRNPDTLHEKNLLIRPEQLPGVPVPDEDVLTILRTHPLELRDRTRRWAKERRELRATEALIAAAEDEQSPTSGAGAEG